MKLAEALLKRSELQTDVQRLRQRIMNNAMVQDGEEPAENPAQLLPVYESTMKELADLVRSINHTNAVTAFEGDETIADALARRSILLEKQKMYQELYDKLQIRPDRYSASEIRFVRCMDPAVVQKDIDKVCQEYRQLDTKLQALNWTVDLL